MEPTIDQALQQGVAAHKDGKLQDAERLYRAILQVQPKHPDANHNLGVLAVAVGKPLKALPLFQQALEANPQIEQFWLSYINALIATERFNDAKQALRDGKHSGVSAEKLDALNQQLQIRVPNNTNKTGKSLALSKRGNKRAEKKRGDSSSAAPPQDQIELLRWHYQADRFAEAELLARSLTQQFPQHPLGWRVLSAVFKQTGRLGESLSPMQSALKLTPQDAEAHYNLGVTLQELERLDEAEASHRRATALKPQHIKAHYNLGNTLQALGRLDEAEVSYHQAIALKPDYAEAHNNLGTTLQALGRLDEAEVSYIQAIALKPDFAGARFNLGVTLQALGRLDEAEVSYSQAIALKHDYAEAHNNLGVTLQNQGRLDEAEVSYSQAIALTPDYAEAHNNLGNALQELERLDEAEASCRRAIAVKPNYANAHSNLSKILYMKGNKDLALQSAVNANDLEPESKDYQIMLRVMEARQSHEGNPSSTSERSNFAVTALNSSPVIVNRAVEPELITSLYKMKSIQLDETKRVGFLASGKADARYGNGIGSPDFRLFESGCSVIQKLDEDLTQILMEVLKSEIYISDSFFNILRDGGGLKPHHHLSPLDRNIALDLSKQKYSLVYYLSVGDQNGRAPGILRLYEPDENILPNEGMIVIFPASRPHSAVYGGQKDRIMIGVNCYSL